MNSIILVLFTGFIMYSIDAFFLGLAFALFLITSKRKVPARIVVPILFLIFVFLDIYSFPAFRSLDITFTVGNDAAAEFFNLTPNDSLNEFMSWGFFDFFIWLVQAVFAYVLGQKIQEKNTANQHIPVDADKPMDDV